LLLSLPIIFLQLTPQKLSAEHKSCTGADGASSGQTRFLQSRHPPHHNKNTDSISGAGAALPLLAQFRTTLAGPIDAAQRPAGELSKKTLFISFLYSQHPPRNNNTDSVFGAGAALPLLAQFRTTLAGPIDAAQRLVNFHFSCVSLSFTTPHPPYSSQHTPHPKCAAGVLSLLAQLRTTLAGTIDAAQRLVNVRSCVSLF